MIQPSASALSVANQRTLGMIFNHPTAHNLEWRDAQALFTALGSAEPSGGGAFQMRVGHEHHTLHKPRTKDMPSQDVIAMRRLLQRAGISPSTAEVSAAPDKPVEPRNPMFLVAIDHRAAALHRIYADGSASDPLTITPDDPHDVQHHLTHKNQDRERGQRAPEEAAFYEHITRALADAGQIVVVGHGSGHSNAAHHLVEYLHEHHHPSHGRVVTEIVADLSAITPAQMLELGRRALKIG